MQWFVVLLSNLYTEIYPTLKDVMFSTRQTRDFELQKKGQSNNAKVQFVNMAMSGTELQVKRFENKSPIYNPIH